MTEPGTPPPTKPHIEDVMGGLTGFDEIAIEQAFHTDMNSLSATMLTRAVAFCQYRKTEGATDKEAYSRAMRLPLRELNDLFDTTETEDVGEGKG
jgi:hypothetical protein